VSRAFGKTRFPYEALNGANGTTVLGFLVLLACWERDASMLTGSSSAKRSLRDLAVRSSSSFWETSGLARVGDNMVLLEDCSCNLIQILENTVGILASNAQDKRDRGLYTDAVLNDNAEDLEAL